MVVIQKEFNKSLHLKTIYHIYDHNYHFFFRIIIKYYLSISGAIVIGVPQYDSITSVVTDLANPKSPNFIYIYSFMRIFASLRSR